MNARKSRVVVHVSGGIADVASIQGGVEVHILDFDNFNETMDMGREFVHPITCPHCKRDGRVEDWNAATILALTGSDEGEGVVRIQSAGEDDEFYCAYCFEPSKASELTFSKE
jgi:hypothetical protein